ncbi:hypothetical protein [Streptomyces sp. NPDC002779]|uniref:hypothetical protein n=1 Tax=Streptomyces sp. NPDC002779 TaxID=3364664 RepID=UPI0036D11854
MNAFLTAAALVVLIAAGAYAIHRLNLQHADRIAVHRYSDPLPGRGGRGTPQPSGPDRSESPPTGEPRDHREGRGRFPPRRRSRTPHHE